MVHAKRRILVVNKSYGRLRGATCTRSVAELWTACRVATARVSEFTHRATSHRVALRPPASNCELGLRVEPKMGMFSWPQTHTPEEFRDFRNKMEQLFAYTQVNRLDILMSILVTNHSYCITGNIVLYNLEQPHDWLGKISKLDMQVPTTQSHY